MTDMPFPSPPISGLVPLLVLVIALAGCAGDASSPAADSQAEEVTAAEAVSASEGPDATSDQFPDIRSAELQDNGDGTFDLAATVSSPYDTPERYADAFRALDADGTVLGIRELTHDHAGEQPFTRTLNGLEIPEDVETITVEGRDLANGWGGASVQVTVPR